MYPILLKVAPFQLFGWDFGGFEVHTYGVVIACSFAICSYVGIRNGLRDGIPLDQLLDLAFWILLSGVIGARLFFMAVSWHDYYNACYHPELPNALNYDAPLIQADCRRLWRFWEGGLVWYGGVIGALVGGYIFAHRNKLSFALAADAAMGALPLGHLIGRLGCFCAGCCYGHLTDSPLGMLFPPNSLPYQERVIKETGEIIAVPPLPVHPTQLYEAAGELMIFLALIWLRRRRRFPGQVALGFLILYPLLRAIIEDFRGDTARGFIVSWDAPIFFNGQLYAHTGGLSVSQGLSLVLMIAAAAIMVYKLKKARAASPAR